jgi:prepilin-type N-terminal cleavage/methylation domain-containing protein
MTTKQNKGFTLLEILLVIAAIGILAAIVLVAINPNRQIAQARNTVRQADINTIQKAVEQYLIENGSYPSSISTTPGYICNTGTEQVGGSTNCSGRLDLRELVPTYLAGIPKDPQDTGTNTWYMVAINPDNNKISISAAQAEGKAIVSNTFIVTNGLILHLDAGNISSYPGTGNTWFDLSGNGNNGTLVNGVGYNPTNGGSFSFDGSNDYLTTSLAGTFAQITFEFWSFFDDINLNMLIREESAFGDWNSGRVHFGTRWTGSNAGMHFNVNGVWQKTPATNLKYGWNHYVLVYDTGLNLKRVYLNTILSSSHGTNGNMVLGDFRIGVATNLNRYYRGNISNFRIYNRSLTPEEIQQNFNSTRGRFGL